MVCDRAHCALWCVHGGVNAASHTGSGHGGAAAPFQSCLRSVSQSCSSSSWAIRFLVRSRNSNVIPIPTMIATTSATQEKSRQPLLGRQAEVVDHRGGAAGPADRTGCVGGQEAPVAHPQCAGQGPGEDPQQRDEAPEEHRPHPPPGEQLLGQGHMTGTEVFRKPLTEPFEQPPHAVPAADRVSDRVADDGADRGGRADPQRADVQSVPRSQQRRTDQGDLARQGGYAETFQTDDQTDDQVHRQRWDGFQYRVDRHPPRMPYPRRLPERTGWFACRSQVSRLRRYRVPTPSRIRLITRIAVASTLI